MTTAMNTTIKSPRQHSWLLGEIMHAGLSVEVWQRCTEDRVMDLEQVGRLERAVLTTADGATAEIPGFWHVQVPQDVRRVLIVDEVSRNLVGVTLRLPDLDIDINDSVLLCLPELDLEGTDLSA